jgi:hypothetical protein
MGDSVVRDLALTFDVMTFVVGPDLTVFAFTAVPLGIRAGTHPARKRAATIELEAQPPDRAGR